MALSKTTNTKTKKTKADSTDNTIAKTDPNKHSAFSLADKLKERKRLNEAALKDL